MSTDTTPAIDVMAKLRAMAARDGSDEADDVVRAVSELIDNSAHALALLETHNLGDGYTAGLLRNWHAAHTTGAR